MRKLFPPFFLWSFSAIDLSIRVASLLVDFDWNVLPDLRGSNHYPIVLSHSTPTTHVSSNHWNIAKADWSTFTSLCTDQLSDFPILDSSTNDFTHSLFAIAEKTIPRTSSTTSI